MKRDCIFTFQNINAIPSRLQVELSGSADEAFISKESSQEELEIDTERKIRDSDE